jgi:dihydroneopterin aldolase
VTDRIEIRGLRVLARVGVLPFERDQDQPVEVDLDLLVDLEAAGASDELSDTVHYGEVCDAVVAAVQAAPVALLERMATVVAVAALAYDRRVAEVEVAVRKLRPPVAQHVATTGVRITRSRP